MYKIFKTEFVFEKYLNCFSLYRTRLAKLRCRSHNLPVNQDKLNQQRDISKGVCVLCSKNDIGDEYHYLFKSFMIFNKIIQHCMYCLIEQTQHMSSILRGLRIVFFCFL